MLRILHDTKIDFIRLWRQAAMAMAIFILPALVLIQFSGFNYSIEFTGGTLMQVAFKQPPDVAQVRTALTQGGVPGVEIARFGTNELVIRAQEASAVEQQGTGGADSVAAQIRATLDKVYGAGSYTAVRTEAVGPRVGDELRRQAAVATLIAFNFYVLQLVFPLRMTAFMIAQLSRARAAAARVYEVPATDPEIIERPHAVPLPDSAPDRLSGEVRFEGVTFGYFADSPVLRDVDHGN